MLKIRNIIMQFLEYDTRNNEARILKLIKHFSKLELSLIKGGNSGQELSLCKGKLYDNKIFSVNSSMYLNECNFLCEMVKEHSSRLSIIKLSGSKGINRVDSLYPDKDARDSISSTNSYTYGDTNIPEFNFRQ